MTKFENHLTNNIIRYSVFLAVLLLSVAYVAETAHAVGAERCQCQQASWPRPHGESPGCSLQSISTECPRQGCTL